jgi:hypothetical protein
MYIFSDNAQESWEEREGEERNVSEKRRNTRHDTDICNWA